MGYFTHMPLDNTTKLAHILLFCDCETQTQEVIHAFRGSDCNIDCYCLESFVCIKSDVDPDIVVLDIGLHIEKGLLLLKAMKSSLPNIPVILLAEDSSEEQVISAFRLGARDYFKKPLNIILFRETVENLLRIKKFTFEQRLSVTARQADSTEMQNWSNTPMPSAIRKSLLFMSSHLADPITLDILAEKVGMSKHHFCRTFKNYVGDTPMQSLASMRVAYAKRLLVSPQHTISMVAVEAGFGNISSFTRHFRKMTGITASAFRKLHKSSAE